MAEQNKLYITITDNRGESAKTIPTPTSISVAQEQEKQGSLLGRYAEHELFHLIKGTTLKAVNYSISNIGNFTGDYITQRNVNYAKGVISNLMSIGMSTITGAKAGGAAGAGGALVGAVIGFVVGTASLAIGSVFEDMSNRAENSKNNFNIEMLRERVGLNTIYDGSRGTEN